MSSGPAAISWVNGAPVGLDPSDRGLAYGDGLFETMACRNGSVRWLDYHLERLAHGCRRLAMPVPDLQDLRRELAARCPPAGRAVVKLIVTRGSGARGYRPPEPAVPNRVLSIAPWPGYPVEHYTSGVEIEPCALRLAENPQLAGLKHLSRLEQVLAQMELAGLAADEGLLRDRSGYVVGGVASNIFALRGRELTTPPLLRCGVHGVARRVVLERAPGCGLEPAQRDLTLEDLLDSDEVLITNALAGVRPVRRIGQHRFAVGPATRSLVALFGPDSDDGG